MAATVIQIDASGIYDDDAVYAALQLCAPTLARARRDGRLRFTRQGRRILYLGRWVLDWLESDSIPPREEVGHGS
jgi:hypothetical protein